MSRSEQQSRDAIEALLVESGVDPTSFDGHLVEEIIRTSLRLVPDGHDTGQLKLINNAMKEMWYAYRIFNRYTDRRKVSMFGSARTPEDHPDYLAARDFGARMAEEGWMCITGAGDGIMKAGHEGPRKEASFGLSIRLPFESSANEVIDGDPKLINFRYFFTRKLMFLSQADAIVGCPGGFGTQDEIFESLVLMQTGKSAIVPIVLLEGTGGDYWQSWQENIRSNLLARGWISPEDEHLCYFAESPEDAVRHILHFYRLYHSSRYVRETLVIRLARALAEEELALLHDEFSSILASGTFENTSALPEEKDVMEMPRLVFHHQRHQYGLLRALINRVNDFEDGKQA